jgi:hypothetical protein
LKGFAIISVLMQPLLWGVSKGVGIWEGEGDGRGMEGEYGEERRNWWEGSGDGGKSVRNMGNGEGGERMEKRWMDGRVRDGAKDFGRDIVHVMRIIGS